MAKQLSESSRQGKLQAKKKPPMSRKLLAELSEVKAMTDSAIDTSGIPERLDWNNAVIGKFYKPVKTQISLRVDEVVLDWFRSRSEHYTSMMNQALRAYMIAEDAASRSPGKEKGTRPVATKSTKRKRA